MNFKNWLNLKQTIPPSEFRQHFYVNDPKNPEQITAWKRKLSKNVYDFPISRERFIHFTLPEYAEKIIEKRIIGLEGISVFAVSLSYGIWFPTVQFNHITAKRDDDKAMIYQLKRKDSKEKLIAKGLTIPEYGKEVIAIMFSTNDIPKTAHREEVVWDNPVEIHNFQLISTRDAINRLKHTPYSIGEDDLVHYY